MPDEASYIYSWFWHPKKPDSILSVRKRSGSYGVIKPATLDSYRTQRVRDNSGANRPGTKTVIASVTAYYQRTNKGYDTSIENLW